MENNRKLKVLACAFACQPHGSTIWAGTGEMILGWNIVCQLARFHDVCVLTSFDNKEDIDKELKKNNFSNLRFYYVKPSFYDKLLLKIKGGLYLYIYLWQIKAYFLAKKLHKEINFDVFHHVTFANDWMASFIGALLPVPYIRGPGGGAHRVPESFTKEYSFKQQIAEKIRSIGQWIFKHDPFFITGQNRAKALLVCNKEAFNALPKKWQEKVYFFPVNGISKEDLADYNYGKSAKDKFLVITAGRLLNIKGFDLAIKSFKIFSDKVSDTKLIVAGDGPELQNLKNLVFGLGISDRVIFSGWVSREELFKKISSGDVFLFASLRDGGGAVVVEAMAAGKPVVCLDLAGPGLHIDEKCGIKIKPQNPKQAINDMAGALEKLYFDEGLRVRLGKRAKEKAEREYNWDRLGEKLLEIYKNTCNII